MNRSMNKSFLDKLVSGVSHVSVLLFSLVCLYPLLLTYMISFSDENLVQIHGFKLIPEKFSLATYQFLWESASRNIINAYLVTIAVTIVGTLTSMLVSTMLAYVMSQKTVRYRNEISLFCYFTVIFSAGLVPWYIVCVTVLHINNTFFGLFLPYAVNVFNVFLLRNYFQSIPDSIVESAKMDGANPFTIYHRLIIPLSQTAMFTVGLFYAMQFWNDWNLAILLMTKKSLYPMQYYLYSLLSSAKALASGQNIVNASNISIPTETVKMAATVITVTPVLFFFPFVQKYFVKGIIVGAVKG